MFTWDIVDRISCITREWLLPQFDPINSPEIKKSISLTRDITIAILYAAAFQDDDDPIFSTLERAKIFRYYVYETIKTSLSSRKTTKRMQKISMLELASFANWRWDTSKKLRYKWTYGAFRQFFGMINENSDIAWNFPIVYWVELDERADFLQMYWWITAFEKRVSSRIDPEQITDFYIPQQHLEMFWNRSDILKHWGRINNIRSLV